MTKSFSDYKAEEMNRIHEIVTAYYAGDMKTLADAGMLYGEYRTDSWSDDGYTLKADARIDTDVTMFELRQGETIESPRIQSLMEAVAHNRAVDRMRIDRWNESTEKIKRETGLDEYGLPIGN